MDNNLRLIVLSNFSEVGKKVDEYLQDFYGTNKSFIVPIEEVRFNNGEGKIVIKDSIRDKDVFILSDVGNYSCTYKMFGFENHKSGDDHFQDIKNLLQQKKHFRKLFRLNKGDFQARIKYLLFWLLYLYH